MNYPVPVPPINDSLPLGPIRPRANLQHHGIVLYLYAGSGLSLHHLEQITLALYKMALAIQVFTWRFKDLAPQLPPLLFDPP